MRMLRLLLLCVFGVAAVALAVANRHVVRFMLDPISGPQGSLFVEGRLMVFLFAALFVGFVFGALATWTSQGRWRRAARIRADEVSRLKRENERLTRHLRAMERAPQIRAFVASQEAENERPLIH
jgi:Zn-dependent protease with chaperone function